MSYVAKIGVTTSSAYAYTSGSTGSAGSCLLSSSTPLSKYLNTTTPSKTSTQTISGLKTLLIKGPVAVAVDATNWSSYSTGIFNACSSTPQLNHGVVAVGYDASNNWIIRNSWGTYWGESGYIRLAAGNTCGVLNNVVVPNLL